MTDLIIRVKCERCKAERNTSSLKSAMCFVCGHNSVIFNKRTNKSRVVSIVKGDRQLLTNRLYKEGIYGKRNTSKKK